MAQISVIVPVYNVGSPLLERAVASVVGQTFGDWEMILVNDASTDDSGERCRTLAASDERIRLVELPVNLGLSGARNAGLDEATGTYVTFLDADDRLSPEFLEVLRAIAVKGDFDIAAAGFLPTRPEEFPTATYDLRRLKSLTPYQAIEEALYQHSIDHSAWGKLYRRELFDFERFGPRWFEDLDIFYRVWLRANKIAWLPDKLYFYTINPASYLRNFTPGRAIVLDVVENMIVYLSTRAPELLPAARDRALSAAFNILTLMKRNRMDVPEIAARCRVIIRRYRCESFRNPRVRLKNKLAIALTNVAGFDAIEFLATLRR